LCSEVSSFLDADFADFLSHEKEQKHKEKLTTNPFDLVRLSSPQVAPRFAKTTQGKQDKFTRMGTNFSDTD
jgi:hypothetical protein